MEYAFELALCATLEQSERVVSRQHGGAVVAAGSRIVDICLLEPGPEFDDRAAITDQTIPAPAIEADIGPGEAIPAREAFDIRPDRRADIVERACEVGYLTRERRGGTPLVRATTRYPDDWFGRLVAIENKPDLDRAGDLQSQLRFDDALGLFDAVVLATESYVTRAHLNRIPDRVGVWRFDPDTGERDVIRQAVPRKPDTRGVEIRDEQPLQTDIAIVSGEAKRRRRRRVAEQVYGKGWRPAPPACSHAHLTKDGRPFCEAFDRVVDPGSDCPDCEARRPADPPDDDHRQLRATRTAWRPNPTGTATQQSGLGQFSSDGGTDSNGG